MRDIIITLPKTVKWADYEKEITKAAQGEIMSFKVPYLPKDDIIGAKCYVVYDGFVRGYMKITGARAKTFTCTTTGRKWDGNFIERSGVFHYLTPPVARRGFQGWHYEGNQ